MKHFYWMIVLCILSTACTETLDIDNDGVEKLLQMDAFLDSSDSLHKVHLRWSSGTAVTEVSDRDSVCVTMYVNDEVVSESHTVNSDGDSELKGSYQAGDRIKLTVKAGSAYVEAETQAPAKPIITQVDTSSYNLNKYFNVSITDICGENNYYRISIWKEWQSYVAEVYDQECGKRSGDYIFGNYEEMQVFGDEEPLLMSRLGLNPKTEDDIRIWDTNIFPDERFADNSYTVRLKTYDRYVPYVSTWTSSYLTIADVVVKVRLHSLSPEAFRYLDIYQFESSDNNFLMVYPSVYPSNVKGGIGFVTAMTSVDYSLIFPSYSFWAGRLDNPQKL